MRRCRSSPPSSSFVSESVPSSKASDRVLSASEVRGSSERRGLDTGEEVRDRKDGGGEDGMDFRVSEVGGSIGVSSWSLPETYSSGKLHESWNRAWVADDVEMTDTYSFVAVGAHDRGSPKLPN